MALTTQRDDLLDDIERLKGEIEEANFYDDPPSVLERLYDQLNEKRQALSDLDDLDE